MFHLTQEDINEILNNHYRHLLAAQERTLQNRESSPNFKLLLSEAVGEEEVRGITQCMQLLRMLWEKYNDIYFIASSGKPIFIEIGKEKEKRQGPGRKAFLNYVIALEWRLLSFGYLKKGEYYRLFNFQTKSENSILQQIENSFNNIGPKWYKFFVHANDYFPSTSLHNIIKIIETQIIPDNLQVSYTTKEHTA